MTIVEYNPVTKSYDGRQVDIPLESDAAGNLKTVSGATGASADEIQGNVASGATDAGKPVKTGGVYNSSLPTFTNGQRGDTQIDSRGKTIVALGGYGSATAITTNTPQDSFTNAAAASLAMLTFPNLFNGTSWDRPRNNVDLTLLASAARTATTSSPDQTNYDGDGVIVVINVTVEGAATLTLTIQGKDPISGNYYDIITGIIVYTAATDAPPITRAIHLRPGIITADFIGIAATVNGSTAKAVSLPRVWRATVTPADATTTTYSLAAANI